MSQELEQIKQAIDTAKEINNAELEKKLQVVYDFVLSTKEADKFSDAQKEDLRKLAKELNFDGDTDFKKWLVSIAEDKPTKE